MIGECSKVIEMLNGSNRHKKQYFQAAGNLQFARGPIHNQFETAVITGVCRSGKTTLGNILATSQYVENAEEPWTGMALPLMVGLKMIETEVGKEMFRKYVSELFNDKILLRSANFRPSDLSSIWSQKSPKEIFFRLAKLHTRKNVKDFIHENPPLLIINLAETLPFASFFQQALPRVKLVVLVRKGLDVAMDSLEKQWNSWDELLKPTWPTMCRLYEYKGDRLQLPWWVSPAEEELFLSYSVFERGVYYWCQLMEQGLDEIDWLQKNTQCMLVHYENLIADPEGIYNKTAQFLGIKASSLTPLAIEKVKERKKGKTYSGEYQIASELVERLKSLYENLGYQDLSN